MGAHLCKTKLSKAEVGACISRAFAARWGVREGVTLGRAASRKAQHRERTAMGQATSGRALSSDQAKVEAAVSQTVELIVGGKRYEFPVIEGTEAEKAIDFSTLRAKTGLMTFDPGYVNTASCRSAITLVDGENGILRYRGYPIEQLAEQSTFLEVSYLLIHGELPTKAELDRFTSEVTHHTM